MLSKVIPCCRKEPTKRDYMQKLLDEGRIKTANMQSKLIEDLDISNRVGQRKFKKTGQKSAVELITSQNQVGICSSAPKMFSPAASIRERLQNLYHYHQFKGNRLITQKFLPRRSFGKVQNPLDKQVILKSSDFQKHLEKI